MSAKVLLCRCEDVTLAEVEHAIESGQRDIESLKRFTGFGTGWCQGKQCLVACSRVLEEKTGSFPLAPHPVELSDTPAGVQRLLSDEEPAQRRADEERHHDGRGAHRHHAIAMRKLGADGEHGAAHVRDGMVRAAHRHRVHASSHRREQHGDDGNSGRREGD